MTENQFPQWVIAYQKRFLGPGENSDFVLLWRDDILPLGFDDAINAIRDVALDARAEARFPRQHLRLLVEYAELRRKSRVPPARKRLEGSRVSSEAWDKRMREIGAIDDDELRKRSAERRAKIA